jgi:hypothetical protein
MHTIEFVRVSVPIANPDSIANSDVEVPSLEDIWGLGHISRTPQSEPKRFPWMSVIWYYYCIDVSH